MFQERDEFEQRRYDKNKVKQKKWIERQERSKENRNEIEMLQLQVADLKRKVEDKDASEGANLEADNNDEETTSLQFRKFKDLPISQRTQMGLERGNYTQLTPIQRDALYLALAGFDVLGAAKTGSGKTLCFVIPTLESLYRERWSSDMGVGALILSPTRELALQIFKVMQLVGHKHVVSAALLTGGRDVQEERKRLHAISIMVGTPGRILHHFQDDSNLVLDNMQLFCMDEADRLLDLGFRDAITEILKYLPPQRQTLLFSATQTTDVQMLAQMALKSPRYVSSHSATAAPVPSTLSQNFLVVELQEKLDALLSFLRRHPSDKVVVFVSTCNQVKYMYLAFSKILKKMRIPSMCLTSKMKQFRREEVFLTYCRCKSAVLFCTDVAARGLDFPLVHWVVQYDCPDSAQTYIHRAGRTARAGAKGANLLFLTPRETPMLSYLANKHLTLREVAIKPNCVKSSQETFVALVVQGLKYEAQKAFIAYLRSIYFASNKNVFELASIDVESFAKSLGLLVVPNMSELQNMQRSAKNLPWSVVNYLARREAAGSPAGTQNSFNGDAENERNGEVASDEDKDEEGTASKPHMTRKEKHLKASDLFRTLEVKQRFATKEGALESRAKAAEQAGGRTILSDSDDDDTFFVKKSSAAARRGDGVADEENGKGKESKQTSYLDKQRESKAHLTVEERMAGLSKNKLRKYVENADLRVKDLGLNQHIVFSDDEDDDGEDNGSGEQTVVHSKIRGVRVQRDSDSDAEDDGEDVSGEGSDEGAFASRLRDHVQSLKGDDEERAKKLRRLRRLQKMGRISRKTTIEESRVTTASGGPRPRDSDDERDDGEESDVSTSSSIARLIRAAKGELYSDDDDDNDGNNGHDDDDDEGDDDDFDPVSHPSGEKRGGYHGIDSSDENESSEDEDEAPRSMPAKKRTRRG